MGDMMIQRRSLMMQYVAPADIDEYEWAERGNYTYFFTETHINLQGYGAEIKFNFLRTGNNIYAFGALKSDGHGCVLAWYNNQWWVPSVQGWKQYNGTFPLEAPTIVKLDAINGKVIQDDTVLGDWNCEDMNELRPMIISACAGNNNMVVYESRIRFYYLKLYDHANGTLIHHLVPANYNGICGIYDKIDHVFSPTYCWLPFGAHGDII